MFAFSKFLREIEYVVCKFAVEGEFYVKIEQIRFSIATT